jgi:hypothetical protein
MLRATLSLLCFCLVTAMTALPVTAAAGEILRETPASYFKWRTTECRKPIQNRSPALSAQASLEKYSQDITRYLACLQREAQRDFEAAQIQMQKAIEAELNAETKRMDEMIKRAYRTSR